MQASLIWCRDNRSDCRQVVIALIVTPEGFPIGYEVLPGNTLDKTTLRFFLNKIESMYGKVRRVWVMDRGIPTEDVLAQMRDEKIQYLVGTPRAMLNKLESKLLDLDWKQANDNVAVKLLAQDNELYVLAKSKDRRAKERAIRKYKLRKYLLGLEKLRKNCRNRDKLLEMRRYSQPELEHRIILDKLKVKLPKQPPPKVYSHQLKR
jgi:transposase